MSSAVDGDAAERETPYNGVLSLPTKETGEGASRMMRDVFEGGGGHLGGRRLSGRLSILAASLGWRQKYSNKPKYMLELDSGKVLVLDQVPNGETSGVGTGAHVWPAAHVLAKYMERRFGQEGMAGQDVVDLGSGTAVMSIVAAALGARHSIATDVASTLPLMRTNCTRAQELLGVEEDCLQATTFDWDNGEPATDLPAATKPDVVLVSDCILPQLYPIEPLCRAIDVLLVPEKPNAITLVSYEHRPYPHFHPRERFLSELAERGLECRSIPQADQHSVYTSDEIELLEVKRRPVLGDM